LHEIDPSIVPVKGKGVRDLKECRLTECFQHLVAFVKNKVLDFASVQLLLPDQSHHSSWSSNDNVRTLLLASEQLLVGRDGSSTVEDTGSDVGHELGETGKLVSDLVG